MNRRIQMPAAMQPTRYTTMMSQSMGARCIVA
jgi:hypothetical protein